MDLGNVSHPDVWRVARRGTLAAEVVDDEIVRRLKVEDGIVEPARPGAAGIVEHVTGDVVAADAIGGKRFIRERMRSVKMQAASAVAELLKLSPSGSGSSFEYSSSGA